MSGCFFTPDFRTFENGWQGAHAATPICKAGRVFIPVEGEAPWLGEFLSELLAFPNAEHDDQVDAFVHGLNRLKSQCHLEWCLEDILIDTGRRSVEWDSVFPIGRGFDW